MKMTSDDYSRVKTGIENAVAARGAQLLRDVRAEYPSDERFRWDLLHVSGVSTDALYQYLNDSHIDTALRHIVEEIGL